MPTTAKDIENWWEEWTNTTATTRHLAPQEYNIWSAYPGEGDLGFSAAYSMAQGLVKAWLKEADPGIKKHFKKGDLTYAPLYRLMAAMRLKGNKNWLPKVSGAFLVKIAKKWDRAMRKDGVFQAVFEAIIGKKMPRAVARGAGKTSIAQTTSGSVSGSKRAGKPWGRKKMGESIDEMILEDFTRNG